MDILSVQGLLAMLQIIVIDILLAGDNAIVIGMAARNLPAHLQKKAIFWGTAGAIILRLVMAFLFVEALKLRIVYAQPLQLLLLLTVSWVSIMLSV